MVSWCNRCESPTGRVGAGTRHSHAHACAPKKESLKTAPPALRCQPTHASSPTASPVHISHPVPPPPVPPLEGPSGLLLLCFTTPSASASAQYTVCRHVFDMEARTSSPVPSCFELPTSCSRCSHALNRSEISCTVSAMRSSCSCSSSPNPGSRCFPANVCNSATGRAWHTSAASEQRHQMEGQANDELKDIRLTSVSARSRERSRSTRWEPNYAHQKLKMASAAREAPG
eukprot:2993724-Pleurochrysis_carterae.AAC.7